MAGQTKKRTRCPNGQRKNAKTGNCEPKTKKQIAFKVAKKTSSKTSSANNKQNANNKQKTSKNSNNKPSPPVKLPAVGGLVFLPANLSKGYRNRTGISGFDSLLDHWDKYSTTGVSKIMKKRQKIVNGKFETDKLGLYIYNTGQFIIKDPCQVRPLTKEEKKRLYKPSKHSRLAQTNLSSFESELLSNA